MCFSCFSVFLLQRSKLVGIEVEIVPLGQAEPIKIVKSWWFTIEDCWYNVRNLLAEALLLANCLDYGLKLVVVKSFWVLLVSSAQSCVWRLFKEKWNHVQPESLSQNHALPLFFFYEHAIYPIFSAKKSKEDNISGRGTHQELKRGECPFGDTHAQEWRCRRVSRSWG